MRYEAAYRAAATDAIGTKKEPEARCGAYPGGWYGAKANSAFDAGMPAEAAAADIKLGVYAAWSDAEPDSPNVMRCYQEFRASWTQPMDLPRMLAGMDAVRARLPRTPASERGSRASGSARPDSSFRTSAAPAGPGPRNLLVAHVAWRTQPKRQSGIQNGQLLRPGNLEHVANRVATSSAVSWLNPLSRSPQRRSSRPCCRIAARGRASLSSRARELEDELVGRASLRRRESTGPRRSG